MYIDLSHMIILWSVKFFVKRATLYSEWKRRWQWRLEINVDLWQRPAKERGYVCEIGKWGEGIVSKEFCAHLSLWQIVWNARLITISIRRLDCSYDFPFFILNVIDTRIDAVAIYSGKFSLASNGLYSI